MLYRLRFLFRGIVSFKCAEHVKIYFISGRNNREFSPVNGGYKVSSLAVKETCTEKMLYEVALLSLLLTFNIFHNLC